MDDTAPLWHKVPEIWITLHVRMTMDILDQNQTLVWLTHGNIMSNDCISRLRESPLQWNHLSFVERACIKLFFFDFPNYRPSFYVYPTQEKKIRQPIPNCLGRISDHILHVLGTYNAIAGTHSEMTGSFFLLHFYKILLKAQAMNTNHFLR